MRHSCLYPLVLCVTASCADRASYPVGVVVQAINYSVPPRLFAPALIATNTNNGAPDGVPSRGTLSGPPTAMRVYLQSVSFRHDGRSLTIYSSTEPHTTDSGIAVTGCQLSLTSGNIDLSVCPGLEQLSVPDQTYSDLTMNFAEVAEVQGCLNATFGGPTTSVETAGTFTYPPPFPQSPFSYTTEAAIPGTLYTFCTRKDRHYYLAETASETPIGNNDDFGATNPYFTGLATPEFVTIDLLSSNPDAKTIAQLEAGSVNVTSATLPTSASPTLTFAVDMNRIFEFFPNVRADFSAPAPNAHTGTSYFFTTRFVPNGPAGATAAVTAYVGDVTAQGYQWTATPTAGGQAEVSGWYTLFLDGSGNYVGGSMNQDDNNGLTILKGATAIVSGSLETGATLSTYSADGTCAGFTTTALNGTGSCSLSASSGTFNVTYKRLL